MRAEKGATSSLAGRGAAAETATRNCRALRETCGRGVAGTDPASYGRLSSGTNGRSGTPI